VLCGRCRFACAEQTSVQPERTGEALSACSCPAVAGGGESAPLHRRQPARIVSIRVSRGCCPARLASASLRVCHERVGARGPLRPLLLSLLLWTPPCFVSSSPVPTEVTSVIVSTSGGMATHSPFRVDLSRTSVRGGVPRSADRLRWMITIRPDRDLVPTPVTPKWEGNGPIGWATNFGCRLAGPTLLLTGRSRRHRGPLILAFAAGGTGEDETKQGGVQRRSESNRGHPVTDRLDGHRPVPEGVDFPVELAP